MLILDKEIETVIENTIIAFKKNYLQYTFEVLPKKIKEIYFNLNYINEHALENDVATKVNKIIVLMFNLELIKEKESKEIKRKYALTEKGQRFETFEKERKKEKMTEENFERQHKQLKNRTIWLIIGCVADKLVCPIDKK